MRTLLILVFDFIDFIKLIAASNTVTNDVTN